MGSAVEYELDEDDWLAFHHLSQAAHPDLRQLLSRATLVGFFAAAAIDLGGLLFAYRVQFPFVLTFFTAYFIMAYLVRAT